MKTLLKQKKVSKTKLKKEAWASFSRYIRARDCLKTTGSLEGGLCFSCGAYTEYRHLHAGHFIPGRHYSVLFDERQVRGQCFVCNIRRNGNWTGFYKHMVEIYGEAVIREMIDVAEQVVQVKDFQLIELKAEYDEKYKALLEERE